MIEGPRLRWAAFGRAGGVAGISAVPVAGFLLLKSILQLSSRLEELRRVVGHAVDPHLVVHVLAGAAAGAAHDAHGLVQRHAVPGTYQDLSQVAVTRVNARAVVDLDHVAVGALRTGVDHAAGRRREHLGAVGAAEVEPGGRAARPVIGSVRTPKPLFFL